MTNASFENQILSDGTWIDGTLTGWSLDGVFAGPQNWTDIQYPGATDNDATPSTVPDGRNSAFSRGPDIWQTLNATLEPNTLYTLEVEVGHRLDGFFPSYRTQLRAGGLILSEDNNLLSPGSGEWLTSTTTFQTGSSHPQLGQPLEIRLRTPGVTDGSGATQANYDNVRLTATSVVPPPQTHVLGVGVRYDDQSNPAAYLLGDSNAQHVVDAFQAAIPSIGPRHNVLALDADANGLTNKLLFEQTLGLATADVLPGDTFVLYMSSHGSSFEIGAETAIVADYGPGGFKSSTGDEYLSLGGSYDLTDDDLANLLANNEQLEDVNLIVILDGCHSGGFGPDLLAAIPNQLGFIASAAEGAVSHGVPLSDFLGIPTTVLSEAFYDAAAGRSLFSLALEDALIVTGGEIAADTFFEGNGDGVLSVHELAGYTRDAPILGQRILENVEIADLLGYNLPFHGLVGTGTFGGLAASDESTPDFLGVTYVPEPAGYVLLAISIPFLFLLCGSSVLRNVGHPADKL